MISKSWVKTNKDPHEFCMTVRDKFFLSCDMRVGPGEGEKSKQTWKGTHTHERWAQTKKQGVINQDCYTFINVSLRHTYNMYERIWCCVVDILIFFLLLFFLWERNEKWNEFLPTQWSLKHEMRRSNATNGHFLIQDRFGRTEGAEEDQQTLPFEPFLSR